MFVALLTLICFSIILSFFEDRLKTRDKLLLYCALGVAMILIAGLRSTDSTPDSSDYEEKFMNSGSGSVLDEADEPTFKFFAAVLPGLGLGVNALFFVYAMLSVPLHLGAIWKISKTPFMTLTVYISYFYMLHDLVQIRAGVAIGLFLWAAYFYSTKRKLPALLCILIGITFHFSAAVGFVIFFIPNRPLGDLEKKILYLIVPVGILAYILSIDISYLIPETLGGDKLALYREFKEKGIEDDYIGYPLKFNLVIWLNIIMYFCAIYYEDVYRRHLPQVSLFIRIQAVGFCSLLFLDGLSTVLAQRINGFYSEVNIFVWACLAYSFIPNIAGKIVTNTISFLRFVSSFFVYALSWYYMHMV